jgi:2-desacetyl-2-hydroxyethyl bacteriochlorophyllide A dehydrogenase
MKALVFRGPRSLVLEEVDRPAVRPGEVLLRVDATGICGSDVHGYLGLTGRRIPPMIMGHEFCGTVVEVGSEVDGVRAGDRAAVAPVMSCGACEPCREGHVYLCATRRLFGVMACNGSMADYLNAPARLLFRMPDAMAPEIGAMVEPSAVALHALSRAGVGLERAAVLVVGAGPIGLLLTGLARRHRPRRLLVSDLSDQRLELARRMGADVTVNPSREDVARVVAEHTGGRGADLSFEAVGAAATVEQALTALRPRGTCVWVGNSQKTISVDMQASVTRELSILGSYTYTLAEFGEALQALARGDVDVRPIISRTAALEAGPELFAALADPAGGLVKVVLERRGGAS